MEWCFEERFQKEAQTEEGVWDFVRTHLEYLPIIKHQGGALQLIQERDPPHPFRSDGGLLRP